MRQPPGDALLPSFSTFASGQAEREKTLHQAGAPNNRWREELSPREATCPVLPGRPYNLAAATVAADLESCRPRAACVVAPWRPYPTEEFNNLLDLDFILSNLLSHPESVAATVSSSASASSSSSPTSSGGRRPPVWQGVRSPSYSSLQPGRHQRREPLRGIRSGAPAAGIGSGVHPPAAATASRWWADGQVCAEGSLSASVSKGSPDCSHLAVVAPYNGEPPHICPKIKQEAVSSCTHLGSGLPLSNGHRPAAHDLPLGRQHPSRTTSTLGPEELLSSRDCHPAMQPTPPPPPPPPPTSIPALGPITHPSCLTRCSPKSCCSINKSSCHLPEKPKPNREDNRGPGRGPPPTLVITRAAAKPTQRVPSSRHTCKPTQVRNLTTVTRMAEDGNSPTQMNSPGTAHSSARNATEHFPGQATSPYT
ncbi:LOW QUALITY PROTEIN: Krueppel-like factor 4 [Plecturocebus cupreus]